METKRIVKRLTKDHPNIVYTVNRKEKVELVVTVTSAVSFRPSITVNLGHAGSEGEIRCLIMPRHGATIRMEIHMNHQKPTTKSSMIVQTILRDVSFVSLDDHVRIEKTAEKSEAYQKMHTLFVVGVGSAVMRPVLEILNNDVICTHGATSGEIQQDALWYLTSRGISKHAAKQLYVDGRIRDTIGDIQDVYI